ncbi:mediator of RNA polymerase II transcription subunit 29 [Cloeon dipterum]|uniref:mediator of RNA polymerase II transcription subunit 29 n=1 Tax=Cloeon dipterum TaxID=197152 RepID=UPI00321F69FE
MQNMPMGPIPMNPGLQPGGLQSPMQQPPANLQQAQLQAQMQQQQQQQEKMENPSNIAKVKSLVGPLKESLLNTLKTGAQSLHQNSIVDMGTIKGNESGSLKFDKNVEEFFSYCDQIELNLKTAIECASQGTSSHKYLPLQVSLSRTEAGMVTPQQDSISYSQFLNTAKLQVGYARELHDAFQAAIQALNSSE